MRAEHGARDFAHRKMPRNAQIAIIRRFCRKLIDISLPFEIFRSLNARFHCIIGADRGSRDFQRRDETRRTQITVILRFL